MLIHWLAFHEIYLCASENSILLKDFDVSLSDTIDDVHKMYFAESGELVLSKFEKLNLIGRHRAVEFIRFFKNRCDGCLSTGFQDDHPRNMVDFMIDKSPVISAIYDFVGVAIGTTNHDVFGPRAGSVFEGQWRKRRNVGIDGNLFV